MKKLFLSVFLLSTVISACNNEDKQDTPVTTTIEIFDAEALTLIDSTVKAEELAKGFSWSEGPVWVPELNALLFSDVPENKMYKWSEKDSLSVFLSPSGFSDSSNVNKMDGSNGLMLDAEGDLVICQHGDRRIASLKSGLQNPSPEFITLADKYNGKKFNSPNDLAIKSNGEIYFTDPPYGIKDEKTKELNFNGVYKVNQNGDVTLLVDSLTKPNGIAFSLDEKTIYIGNSDPDKAFIYSYQVDSNGVFSNPQIFFNASPYSKSGPGSHDGLKVHKSGNLFATGPGGVYIISPQAKILALIRTSKPTSNCAFDAEQKYLYMTTTDRLLRIQLK